MVQKNNVQFTILNKESGILTKRIFLNEEGKLDKDSTQCFLSIGTAQVHQCAFSEFPNVIKSLHKNECIVHGIFDDQKYGNEDGFVGIIKKDWKQSEYPDENFIISRSLDYFSYPESNAITMFDYDIEEGKTVLSAQEYINVMSAIIPGFDKCAKVITPSTSSCIYDQNGNLLTDNKPSFHMYFVVKDSADIPRFKETLFKRCWLEGYGIIRTDRVKKIHNRTIFDAAVFSPERLDFVAGAQCEDGLIQKLPDPEFIDGDVLDTSLLKNLSHEEEVEYSRILHDAKKPYLKDYEAHKEVRIKRLKEDRSWSEMRARNYVNDFDDYILWNACLLSLDNGKEITVKELLDNGEKYDGITMRDHFEPEKGINKAKFFWNDGNDPKIHSFIRHERNFSFKKYFYHGGKVKPKHTDKEPTFGALDGFLTREESRKELEKSLKVFFGKSFWNQLIIMDAGLGKTRSFMKEFSGALQRTTRLYSIRVAYFVPDNDLSNELLREYCDRKNLVGMPCMIRGRGHHNEHLKPPCKWAKMYHDAYLNEEISADEYNRKVGLLNAKVCKKCGLRRQCEYLNQFKHATHSHIIFFPHQYLFTMTTELKALVSTITHIVVDEDIVGSHILDNTLGTGIFTCDRKDSDIAKDIIDDVEHGPEMKHVLFKWKEQIADEYRKHREVKKLHEATSIMELDSPEYINSISAYKRAEHKRIFWRVMKDACDGLEQFQNTSVVVNNVWVDGNELKVSKKQEINTLWHDKKMLYLDASADPDIVRTATGRKFKVKRIKTHYHDDVEIRQIPDNHVTSSHLKNNYKKIFTSLNSYFDGTIPPFITTKSTEERVKKEGLVPHDHKSGHYKKIRGTDMFKDDGELLIIGRYQINPNALEEKARLLYPKSAEPLNFDRNYQDFVYRMADGYNQSVQQKDYEIGSDVWTLNNHLSRSETEQAIARKRLFDVEDGKKKIVYIYTSQVLDITVNKLIPSSHYMLTAPRNTGNEIQDALLKLMRNNNGILRWKPTIIFEMTGIPTAKLNSTRQAKWFSNNPYWYLETVTYEKIGKRSRKTTVTDKLLVLNGAELDEEVVENFNTYEPIQNIKFAGHWT